MDETVALSQLDLNLLEFRKLKVCPVVIRNQSHVQEILVFQHPLAGVQLVKGILEKEETLSQAALRELREESGILEASVKKYLGSWSSDFQGQQWHFILCEAGNLPVSWTHFCEDDGGHSFHFFWYPLHEPSDNDWHPVYVSALNYLHEHLPF
ncbi:MAG: NUDIX hydrolase [Endozoicomonas sp.]|uniref:NUDIX hydrolase n=1 Tax=Endozoicomonas sp. TaxID=1892382 RepID=UPI003D9B27AA